LVARSLSLALNPTLDRVEIAHRILEIAGSERAPLARALGRLMIRSLDSPSRAAERATGALRHALEIQDRHPTHHVPDPGIVGRPWGPAA
jgi:hypothetical protein